MEVIFALRDVHGGLVADEERSAEVVPRVGEIVAIRPGHAYEVVDVLWHYDAARLTYVTVTAVATNWHSHIARAMAGAGEGDGRA